MPLKDKNISNTVQVMSHICYDLQNDEEMMTALMPSIEEAALIQDSQVALDYIAKRGPSDVLRSERFRRIKYAKDLLQKEFLPHIGIGEVRTTENIPVDLHVYARN